MRKTPYVVRWPSWHSGRQAVGVEHYGSSYLGVPKKNPRGLAAAGVKDPGDDLLSRACNIIGGSCLTTVFGMRTGMASCL